MLLFLDSLAEMGWKSFTSVLVISGTIDLCHAASVAFKKSKRQPKQRIIADTGLPLVLKEGRILE
jgi:hypothetical protein